MHDVLLHSLHISYASLIVSFASTSSSSTSLQSPNISTLRKMLGKSNYIECTTSSWEDILEGTQSLCGIYMASVNACQCCSCYDCGLTNNGHSYPSDKDIEEQGGMYYELILAAVSLAWVHDCTSNNNYIGEVNTGLDDDEMQIIILRTLTRLLKYGLVINTVGKNEFDTEEQLSNILAVIQNIHSAVGDEDCTILGDMLNLDENALGEETLLSAIRSKFGADNSASSHPPPPQLQYLVELLKSFPRSKISQQSTITIKAAEYSIARSLEPSQEPHSLTDIQIAHVKSILPSLGDGFIEEALKCYSHDVERTVEALLQLSDEESNTATTNTIHPRLLTLPTNLPRKLRESVHQYSANVNMHRGTTASTSKEDGKEHAKIQKEYLKRVEQKAEEDAYLMENVLRMEHAASTNMLYYEGKEGARHDYDDYLSTARDEYDDDYDDQYDGIGDDGGMAGGIGGLDEGLYDMDIHNSHPRQEGGGESRSGRVKNEQDLWRKYNTLIREDEAESRYWQDNQNMNRTSTEEGGDGNTTGTRYRGLDKGRGGRLIGPDGKYLPLKHGGKKGRGMASTGGSVSGGNAGRGAGAGDNKGESGGAGDRGGRGSNATSDTNASNSQGSKVDGELSKLQKRRKNDNKAKIGNHHRKDRATKKAAGIIPQG